MQYSYELVKAQKYLLQRREDESTQPTRSRGLQSVLDASKDQREPVSSPGHLSDQRQAAVGILSLLIRLDKTIADRKRREAKGPGIPRTITAYPTLLNAIHKSQMIPAGRVYLLLRAYDQEGRGIVRIDDIRRLLTAKGSRWRCLGWRRLRQILRDGEGIFWNRYVKGRIWLQSPARIAAKLDCGRFRGDNIKLPVKPLLASIQSVRAHFFASFESGRREDTPISQAALATITGVPARTQRDYNKLLKRTAKKNITVTGLPFTPENIQNIAYEKQRSVFRFKDWTGKLFNHPGESYLAYRIADYRSRCHKVASRGRIRKINKAIQPSAKLSPGNNGKHYRTYHPSIDAAGAAYNRESDRDHYYPTKGGIIPNTSRKSRLEGVNLWGVILAQ